MQGQWHVGLQQATEATVNWPQTDSIVPLPQSRRQSILLMVSILVPIPTFGVVYFNRLGIPLNVAMTLIHLLLE